MHKLTDSLLQVLDYAKLNGEVIENMLYASDTANIVQRIDNIATA